MLRNTLFLMKVPKHNRENIKDLFKNKDVVDEILIDDAIVFNVTKDKDAFQKKENTAGLIHLFAPPFYNHYFVEYKFIGDQQLLQVEMPSDFDNLLHSLLKDYISSFCEELRKNYSYIPKGKIILTEKYSYQDNNAGSQKPMNPDVYFMDAIGIIKGYVNKQIAITAYCDNNTFGVAITSNRDTLYNIILNNKIKNLSINEKNKLISSSICLAIALGKMIEVNLNQIIVSYQYYSEIDFPEIQIPENFKIIEFND